MSERATDDAEVDALAIALQRGDVSKSRALAPIVVAEARRIAAFIVPPGDVEDVVQNTAEVVLLRIGDWSAERGAFRVWVRMLARSRAHELLRIRLKAELVPGAAEFLLEADEFDELSRVEDASLVRCLLEALIASEDKPAERVVAAALDLASSGGKLTVAAIARQAELSESTARRAMTRARAVLRMLERPR